MDSVWNAVKSLGAGYFTITFGTEAYNQLMAGNTGEVADPVFTATLLGIISLNYASQAATNWRYAKHLEDYLNNHE